MIKKMQKTILIISILIMAGMASAASADLPKAGQSPGDVLYFLDRFSESLELTVAKAPIIGSSKLEAKVRTNHAAERLAEAQKLAGKNESKKVNKLMEEYSKQSNMSIESAEKANNTDLSKRLRNITKNHVNTLKEVRQRVPEQAKKDIQNAIDNSQKNQRKLNLPESARNRGKPDNPGTKDPSGFVEPDEVINESGNSKISNGKGNTSKVGKRPNKSQTNLSNETEEIEKSVKNKSQEQNLGSSFEDSTEDEEK